MTSGNVTAASDPELPFRALRALEDFESEVSPAEYAWYLLAD